MLEKPVVSPGFTIEDIHRIREYHYELTKDMTVEERCAFYNEGAKEYLRGRAERMREAGIDDPTSRGWENW